jgi:Undecaprenyl-phosphate glucose phosphotransferase
MLGHDLARFPRFSMRNFIVGAVAIGLGCLVSALVAIAVGTSYHIFAYGDYGDVRRQAVIGGLAGIFYATPFLIRGDYTIPAYLTTSRRPQRVFMSWNAACLGLLVFTFMMQTTVDFSRVTAVLFYGAGLLAMIALEATVRTAIVGGLRQGVLPPRRVMLVGPARATGELKARLENEGTEAQRIGVRVVAVANLPGADFSIGARHSAHSDLPIALEHAVMKARAILPDEVVIATRWDDAVAIEAAVSAFQQLPVAIHLDGGPLISGFSEVHLRKVGTASTLSLAELPLSPLQVIAKRILDVFGSLVGLILLSPLFAAIAIAIRLDSRGPVLFRQSRLGFNQQSFEILKFRSMVTADNGHTIEQAKVGDSRITRVGSFLRRTSLDELPQLLNVLKGDMSLVGPRPHAVAHDRDYERRIRRYPRRLNMKPGITGWAQVNGLRGETDTIEKMQNRVEADLYYIDNWSLFFDIYIVLLTVVSPKVFRNAR